MSVNRKPYDPWRMHLIRWSLAWEKRVVSFNGKVNLIKLKMA